MPKQTLLVVINNFGKGGAETLLVGILPELNERYEVIIAALSAECDFREDEIICSKKYILGFNSKLSFITCCYKLKKIIEFHRPSIVHTHLVFSSIMGRVACPANIPLVYSIHNVLSEDIFSRSKIFTLLEKITVKKRHSLIAVSEEVLADYHQTMKRSGKEYILKNYISNDFINQQPIDKDFNTLPKIKLVAVGNIKVTKNYIYLIEAFKQLRQYDISLHIYGRDQAHLQQGLQQEIDKHDLPIIFEGKADNVNEVLMQYDVYVLPSKFEGFGISVVEAMSLGLPLLLSDLPVLRNVTFNNALFFDVKSTASFVDLVKNIFDKRYNLNELSKKGIDISRNNYSKEIYLKNLFNIYDEIISDSIQ